MIYVVGRSPTFVAKNGYMIYIGDREKGANAQIALEKFS